MVESSHLLRDLDILTANGKIPGLLCNMQFFVVVTSLSARMEFMNETSFVACSNKYNKKIITICNNQLLLKLKKQELKKNPGKLLPISRNFFSGGWQVWKHGQRRERHLSNCANEEWPRYRTKVQSSKFEVWRWN